MRIRLIQGATVWRMGADQEDNPVTEEAARDEAAHMVEIDPDKRAVAVYHAPFGGTVRHLFTVGDQTRRRR